MPRSKKKINSKNKTLSEVELQTELPVEEPKQLKEEIDETKEESKKEPEKVTSSNPGLVKNLVILVISVALLVAVLVIIAGRSPYDGVMKEYSKYPDSVISIQKISSGNSQQTISQIKSYCPGFLLEEFYLAEIVTSDQNTDIVFVLNPITGSFECKIDKSRGVQGSSGLVPNLLATVNGEQIYTEDVLAIYNSVPENLRDNQTLQQAFGQIVNNKLLLQDAMKKGLSVSDSEIDSSVSTFLSSNGLTIDGLETMIKQSNSTMEKFRKGIKENILLQKAIVDVTDDVSNATDMEARSYYDINKNNITSIPRSSSRQLTIYANSSNSEEKLEYIKRIGNMINATNFCEIVEQYSEDTSSKGRCGAYNASAGQLLPEYEEAVFSSKPGDRKIIGTRIGYHIIDVVSVTPARNLTYEEAKPDIQNYLTVTKKQQALLDYLAKLRESAEIKNYAAGK